MVIISSLLFTTLSCKEDVIEEEEIIIPEAQLLNESGYIYEDIKIELTQDEDIKLSAIFLEESDNQYGGKRRLEDYTRDKELISFEIPDIKTLKEANSINIILEFENDYEITLKWSVQKPKLISINETLFAYKDTLLLKIKGIEEDGNFFIHDKSEEITNLDNCLCYEFEKEIISDSTVNIIQSSAAQRLLFSKVYLGYEIDGVIYDLDQELTFTSKIKIKDNHNPNSFAQGSGIQLDFNYAGYGLGTSTISNAKAYIGDFPLLYYIALYGNGYFELPETSENLSGLPLRVYSKDIPYIIDSNNELTVDSPYFTLDNYKRNVNEFSSTGGFITLSHVYYGGTIKIFFKSLETEEVYQYNIPYVRGIPEDVQEMKMGYNIPYEVISNAGTYEVYLTAGMQEIKIEELENRNIIITE
ncbi:hypothetical protein ABWH96_05970 [Marivirga tractuosa]|uniref:hypothetical protein n=1 Tax=Marivirga tractuosa TaxID=1006 RepID=UPI0035D075AB